MAELKEDSKKAIKELADILAKFGENWAEYPEMEENEVFITQLGEWVAAHSLLGHLVVLGAFGHEPEKGEGNDVGRESEKAEETEREGEGASSAAGEKAKPEGEEGAGEVQPAAEGEGDEPTAEQLSEAQALVAKLNEIYVAADNLHDKISELSEYAKDEIPEWLEEHDSPCGTNSMRFYIEDQLSEAEGASDDLMDGCKNLSNEVGEFLEDYEGE